MTGLVLLERCRTAQARWWGWRDGGTGGRVAPRKGSWARDDGVVPTVTTALWFRSTFDPRAHLGER